MKIRLGGAIHQVTVKNTIPPIVKITNPANGAIVSKVITITATATDDSMIIRRVEFYIDGSLKYTDPSFPYSVTVNTKYYSNGKHTIKVIAYDDMYTPGEATCQVMVKN